MAADRSEHPAGTGVVVTTEPGLRLRYLFTVWRSCADWQTRGAMLRLTWRQWRARAR